MMEKKKLQIIAYYLPQYHTIPENDEWWGKGFTEWVNVKKAKPLYRGHKQPNVPDPVLGYYNLLDDKVRRKQTELAKEAGIDGFCYWHYWFGNGKELLEKPFQKTLADKKNDFGFCLGWANESWKRKQWNKDGLGDVTLIEQLYLGKDDDINHFNSYLPAFWDPRYITIDGRPVFLVYKPLEHPYMKEFITLWQQLAKDNGLKGFCFIAELNYQYDKIQYLKSIGFEYVTCSKANMTQAPFIKRTLGTIKNVLLRRPLRVVDYCQSITWQYTDRDNENEILPGLEPNWDHSPRSGNKCHILHGSTPKLFGKLVESTLKKYTTGFSFPILFIKSWNEWGEGNYMEPDSLWGKQYIEEMGAIVKAFKKTLH